ncbi:MAG: aminotransferase class IV [Rhizobiales bacterium]|nr:aminotransferase class IV [Hyphomicrobiales bacterium]
MGIGGGIVYDSVAEDEYEEALLKMKFIKDLQNDFQLIESLYFNGEYAYLSEHLDRLCNSSDALNFKFNRSQVKQDLLDYGQELTGDKQYKIRLLLFKSGLVEIGHSEIKLDDNGIVYNVALSEVVLEKSNVFTRHKTTKRLILDQARERMQAQFPSDKIDEVIFCNRQGNITEGSYTTIFIEQDGVFYTPPLSAGLLNGVLRHHLLDSQPDKYKIKNFKFTDLNSTDKIWVGNSVRGLIRANLLD